MSDYPADVTSLIDRTVATLRASHDDLAEIAGRLSPEELERGSGADEWSLAQVFSHLGSGSEINLAALRAALGEADRPGDDFNQSVWDRWNALTPRQQAGGFVEHDERLVAALEALTPGQRETLTVPVSFMPQPLPVEQFAGMRLGEVALHGWDVRAGFDQAVGLRDDEAGLNAEFYAGPLSFMTGFVGKTDRLAEKAAIDVSGSGYGLEIADGVAFTTTPPNPTATFDGPLESAIRLMAGRLKPTHTPAGVSVTGNVTLDDLRRVFPGY